MKLRFRPVLLVMVLGALASAARAELWQTTRGEKCEGKLSGVYGATVLITGKAAAVQLPLEHLDDASLARVADFLATRPAEAPAWNGSSSAVAKSLRNRMQVWRDGKLVSYEPGARPEPEVYLVYFGAMWCGPCRRFSPDLVKAYNALKQQAPDYFELVFVSSDHDESEQRSYVREVGMPWPVIKYSALGRVTPLEKWSASGIPNLVAVTREGDLIFHSYRGTEYLGPQSVLTQFTELLKSTQGDSEAVKRARHRLAVLQYVRAANGSSSAVKPYLISLDRRRYQTLTVKTLTATLTIDEKGKVTDAKFEPALPTAIDFQMSQDAGNWLFLPPVKNGQPKGVKIALPLNL